jgi:acyl-CoA thioester hydrolase
MLTPLTQHEITFRVRYQETDAQGRVHHGNYITYFEMGRTEMLRAMGWSYREFEETGLMLVVAKMDLNYHLPADYDDLLRLVTRVVKARGARLEHTYEIYRGEELLVTGSSLLACVDSTGRPTRLPEVLRGEAKAD